MFTNEILKRVLSRNPASIKTKKECYSLYESGFFGNKVRTWNSYENILKSGYNGKVSIRSKGKISWKTIFAVDFGDVFDIILDLRKKGIEERDLSFLETPPDNRLLFQGEIMFSEKGLYFYYSDLKAPMGVALRKNNRIVFGLGAVCLLRNNLWPSSFDHIMELLELFPNDVIEFSCYDCCVGEIPGRNVVIWEVRDY